jgi:GntR family negative regulator for fad regulon and positive regulator of fabA
LLTVVSGNPIYTLILNGFHSLYLTFGPVYFSDPGARRLSNAFYSDLQAVAEKSDPEEAYRVVLRAMRESLQQWEARS